MMNYISWTKPMLKAFKIAYDKAIKEKLESFYFENNEYFTSYAKYIIEYLEPQFLNKK